MQPLDLNILIREHKSSIKKMITNYHRHLFLLTIVVIFLVLFPIVNCTSDQMKARSVEKKMQTTAIIRNTLNNILEEERLNNDSEEEHLNNDSEEEIKHLLADMMKIYPKRRAALFHAMRGKRSTNIT
ncbi:unnamed protein product [Rotaria sordida]|uniref:Uncharacterized protein n=1 Tax=Rotaria sordida TaxID=392033 RepID=A0A814B0B1_9BILA|nr:unnamed protein product [Rotaria sordida]CAF0920147.1 unnamed protein product [Rotaria sordida]CAF1082369.1 unnamed protein product [Rotaria sordida]CAF1120032.1 unnamed protein product [Rotaria sordida]